MSFQVGGAKRGANKEKKHRSSFQGIMNYIVRLCALISLRQTPLHNSTSCTSFMMLKKTVRKRFLCEEKEQTNVEFAEVNACCTREISRLY